MSDFGDASDDSLEDAYDHELDFRMSSPVAQEDRFLDEPTAFVRDADILGADAYPRFEEEEEDEEDEPSVRSLTVAEFVFFAKQLLESGDMASFSRFVLNGLHEGVQYQVDPIKNALRDSDIIEALRDYDSILGIHSDVCVTTELTIYPVSKFEDTLSRNIHVKIAFDNQFVSLRILDIIYIHIKGFRRDNIPRFPFIKFQTFALLSGPPIT